jgi:hypothetical protein
MLGSGRQRRGEDRVGQEALSRTCLAWAENFGTTEVPFYLNRDVGVWLCLRRAGVAPVACMLYARPWSGRFCVAVTINVTPLAATIALSPSSRRTGTCYKPSMPWRPSPGYAACCRLWHCFLPPQANTICSACFLHRCGGCETALALSVATLPTCGSLGRMGLQGAAAVGLVGKDCVVLAVEKVAIAKLQVC